MKLARFGIKLYLLCVSSGYTYRFCVYTGREDLIANVDAVLPAEVMGFTKPEKMVLFMILPLLHKGYHIFMDNWYSTMRPYLYLCHQKTVACKTARINQVLTIMCQQNIQHNQTVDLRAGPLKFHDKKVVHMLKTCHTEATKSVTARGHSIVMSTEQYKSQ